MAEGLSNKQIQILTFSKTSYQALICDGAVRSGKTSVMSLAFIIWAMNEFNQRNFSICGKTVQSAVRNVITPLLSVRYLVKKQISIVLVIHKPFAYGNQRKENKLLLCVWRQR